MVIVKRNRNNCNNRAIASKTLHRNKKPRWSKYVFPKEDIVPADRYYSVITHIEHTHTYSNKEAIAVYYKIMKFSDAYNAINTLSYDDSKLQYLYIKQVYPIESDAYDRFLASMYEESGLDDDEEITMDMCIGLTESICIGYVSRTGIGGITDRCYWDDKLFVEYYQHQQQTYTAANDDYGIEYDEYGNQI